MSAEQTYVMGSRIIGNNLANIFNRNLSYATEFFSYFNEIGNFEKMISNWKSMTNIVILIFFFLSSNLNAISKRRKIHVFSIKNDRSSFYVRTISRSMRKSRFFHESRMNFLWNVLMEQFQRHVEDIWFAYVMRHAVVRH